jgi:hypothetical protein
MTYLDVRLAAGASWRYTPPPGHDVAWLSLHAGALLAPEAIDAGELVVFEEGPGSVELRATRDSAFVLGSAARHPHDLVTGYYSVHTNEDALARGEANIRRLGVELGLA